MIVENEVRQTPFGHITFYVKVVNGVAQIDTLNCTKNKRIKYNGKKEDV